MSRRSFLTSAFASLMFWQTGPDLHDRLVHLRLDSLLENHLALLQDFGLNVRPQIPRLRIDRLVFLFNSDGECRQHITMSRTTTAASAADVARTPTARGMGKWP